MPFHHDENGYTVTRIEVAGRGYTAAIVGNMHGLSVEAVYLPPLYFAELGVANPPAPDAGVAAHPPGRVLDDGLAGRCDRHQAVDSSAPLR